MTIAKLDERRAAVPRPGRARVDERVADLLGRMTREEKVAQLGSAWVFQLADGRRARRERAAPLLRARPRPGDAHLRRELARRRGAPRDSRTRSSAPRRGDPARHPGDRARGDLLRADGARGDRLPAGDRPREHVGAGARARARPTRSACRCARSARTRASRPCSTSAATRAGAGPRRRSARTRTSSRGWASRSCAACRATTCATGVVATAKHFVGYGASEGGMNWAPAAHPAARAARGLPPPVRGRGARRPALAP